MKQQSNSPALEDAAPKPPAKGPEDTPEEPVQEIRPEDEAKVVERLRELGYIE
jgi:hypothetical protein